MLANRPVHPGREPKGNCSTESAPLRASPPSPHSPASCHRPPFAFNHALPPPFCQVSPQPQLSHRALRLNPSIHIFPPTCKLLKSSHWREGRGRKVPTSPLHTDPEFQAIVQGLEVSSPSFRAILGVLFCDYDVSQGLRG